MAQIQKLVGFSLEDQYKLGVELAMTNFIQSYIAAVGGDFDEQEDVDAAMSLWFKASNDVKVAQLERFEDEEDEEAEGEESEEAA